MWLADSVGTMLGQSSEYWQGDFSQAHELNPLFRALLVIGPLPFALGAVVSLVILTIVVRCLNVKLAGSVLFLATLIHCIGAATWIIQVPRFGVLLLVVFALVVKIKLERDWRRFMVMVSPAKAS